MAKQYSVKSFLLALSDYSAVGQYFQKIGVGSFKYKKTGNHDKDHQEVVELMEKIIAEQSESKQLDIERDFSLIHHLANEKGTQNLLAEARDHNVSIDLPHVPDFNGFDIAFWFFNNHKPIFDQAHAVQQFYDLSGWKRVPVPQDDIGSVVGKKQALEDALKIFFTKEGRGKYCQVEAYPKHDRVYIVTYVSDYGTHDITPDEVTGKLKRTSRRPCFEVYYLYRPNKNEEDGAELEIKAKGGWQRQQDLLQVFAQAVFNFELDNTKQTFDLELLKNPSFNLIADPEDQMNGWWLKSLELRTPDRSTNIKVTVSDDGRPGVEIMWDQLKQLNLAEKMPNMIINRADIQIKFKPSTQHPKGTASFFMNWKDSSGLNSIDDLHIRARSILKKSKLDRGFNN